MQITPEWLDRWRIWPRMIMTLYGVAFYRTTEWFMAIPADEVTNAQSAFVSVIVGAGAGFFGIYTNNKPSGIIPATKKEVCKTCGK